MVMLTAIRRDGTLVKLLPRRSKEALKKEKEKEEFFCPECKEKVIMKIGTKKMEHFAHQKGSQCVESYERETDYHINGKIQLYDWLEIQQFKPRLEPYFPSIRQRPDISVSCFERNYALEFQCSVIPPELMVKRTNQYQSEKIIPIWILGGKNIKRKGKGKVSLSSFDYLFLTKSPSNLWYLPAYCPTSKIFILLTSITPVTSKNALSEISIFSHPSFLFHQLIAPVKKKITCNLHDWKHEIQIQKSSLLLQGYHSNQFIKELYLRSMNILLLPAIIGLPVPNSPMIETPPLIWQAYLFIDHLHQTKKNVITFDEVYRSFMKRIQKQQIKLRTLPLVSDYDPSKPLIEYLQLLSRLKVLETVNDTVYKLNQEVKIPEHCTMQQQQEDSFYQKFAQVIFR